MKEILIVEDSQEILNEISDIFEMEGFEVIKAKNGLEGYLKATNNLPDIIVSDIMMPVMDGYKMLTELKLNPTTNQIPVIFLSALSADNDIRKGMNLGAEDYLKKPVDSENLLTAAKNKIEKNEKFDAKFDKTKINIINTLYHEINNPLNGVIGFSDYLLRRADELSIDNIKKVAENIYNSGQKLNKLAQKYLIYSKLKLSMLNVKEIKKLKNCGYISTDKKIKNILKNNKYFQRKDDFFINLADIKVKIEDELFEALIFELIENALKFSTKGQKVEINSYLKDSLFILKIKNEGQGLPFEKLLKLNNFNQNKQDKFTKGEFGIGLSLVSFIVDIYDLEIVFNSIQGNYFSVELKFNKFLNNYN